MDQNLSNYNEPYYKRETWFEDNGLLRPDQLAALCYAFGRPFWHFDDEMPRDPGLIYSIGCGSGYLERKLESMGCRVIGIDPAPGAKSLYKGTVIGDEYMGDGDTIIFCESIEHIPTEKRIEILSKVPNGARIIITNWPDFHPIAADDSGWDHITRIDDELYDKLQENMKVILRRGSHLVLEKQ